MSLPIRVSGPSASLGRCLIRTVQIFTYEKPHRDAKRQPGTQSDYTENVLGLLPMSHIYGLVVICHASVYRGDGVIVLPKFDFAQTLGAIQRFKINSLFLVSLKEPGRGTS
jgi:acyl-CoA synthetase (AMP-forming)/AMP-acid ligase II